MVDLALEQFDVGLGDAEAVLGEIADDPHDALLVDAPAVAKLGETAL